MRGAEDVYFSQPAAADVGREIVTVLIIRISTHNDISRRVFVHECLISCIGYY